MTTANATVVDITPEVAQRWLDESNIHNRSIKPSVVAAYVRDMQNNRWRLTGEPIKFDNQGTLLDGQHRLQAISRLDKSISTFVVFGLDSESQDVMDSGVKRGAADALVFEGTKNANDVSATARLALSMNENRRIVNVKLTNAEVQEYVRANPELPEAIGALRKSTTRHVPITPRVATYAFWVMWRVDPNDAIRFMTSLETLADLDITNPILVLHRRLAGTYGANRKISIEEQLSLVFRAWNYWRRGERLRKLPSQTRGELVSIPEIV